MTVIRPLLKLATLLLLGSNGASAQTATVQSGEHETFSRLVFADTPGRSWNVQQAGEDVLIEFSDGRPDLDLEGIFDLIPRDRLRTVAFEDGRLALSLACACPVKVSQIRSGHVVIDIFDPSDQIVTDAEVRAPVPPPIPVLPIALPLAPISPYVLSALQNAKERVPEPAGRPVIEIDRLQLTRHPMGSLPLLSLGTESEDAIVRSTACEIDVVAREVLSADPEQVLKGFLEARAPLLDGEDLLDPQATRALVMTYLKLGWGAEAAMVATNLTSGSEIPDIIASALDGMGPALAPDIDPGCGTGAAVIALLTTIGPENWNRADEPAVIAFLASLSSSKYSHIEPRLRRSLDQIGRGSMLTGLAPPIARNLSVPPLPIMAAGADMAAATATTQLLITSNEAGAASDPTLISNAQALRPSLPPGLERDTLDAALVEALVLSDRPADAVRMVVDERSSAGMLFSLAQRHLAAEDAAEIIVRLRPLLEPNDPLRLQARDLFLEMGLEETARRFAEPPSLTMPRLPAVALMASEPWLARDYASLTAAPPEDWTPRTRLAAEIVARNASEMPIGDLAAADAVLTRARAISALVEDLIAFP